MNKRIKNVKLAATLIAVSMFTSSESFICYANAESKDEISYRTNCFNLYGDLNDDKYIDTFDIIEMRKMIVENEYSVLADLNHDEKINVDDLTMLNDYVLGKNVIFDSYFYDDADEDSVCDLFEVLWLKTNPDSADTDGDTISDYNEIVYSRTSPTDKYTRGLSVTDSEDDYDEDNLTNAEEIAAGTDPQLSDTDMDDISDYDEIKKYNTNPNDDDSDDDNINDSDELKLGLKPDSNKSDGENLDNERTFEQEISSDNALLSNINTDENPYNISVETDSAGIAEKEFIISKSRYSRYINDNILGNAIDVSYNENLSLANLKLIFNLNEKLYKNNDIEDYMVFEFLPEKNYLLPVETKYDENKVYIETERESTYCLVKKQDVFSANNDITVDSDIVNMNIFSKNKSASSEPLNTENQEIQIAFLMDSSIFWNDEIEKSFNVFCSTIKEEFPGAIFILDSLKSHPSSVSPFFNTSSFGIVFRENMKSNISAFARDHLQQETSVVIDGMINHLARDDRHNDYINSFYTDECKNKYAFIIDSNVEFDSSEGTSIDAKIKRTQDDLKKIAESEIKLNLLLTPPESESTIQRYNQLKTDCQKYNFGIYSFSENENYASDISSIIYSDLIFKDSNSVNYNLSVNLDSIPKKVNKNALINSMYGIDVSKLPEADENGDIDFEKAINKLGIKFETLSSACSENDQNKKGLEQLLSNFSVPAKIIGRKVQILPFSDRLLRKDSDGDTIPDVDDPFPDEAFDNRFEIVDDYNHVPSVDFVEKHYNYGSKCYESKILSHGLIFEPVYITFRLGSNLAFSPILQLFESGSTENKQWTDVYEKFNFFLNHYLIMKGKLKRISSNDMESIISSQNNNIEHYVYNINAMKQCAEQVLKENDSYNSKIISTTSNSNFMVACYDGPNCKHHPKQYDNSDALDWGYAIGEALGGMTAEVYYENDKYHMNLKYYLIDTYEFPYHWTELDHKDFVTRMAHGLHETGYAKEYRIIGCLENTFEWSKGEILFEDLYNENIEVDIGALNEEPLY